MVIASFIRRCCMDPKKVAVCHSREGGNPEKTLKIDKII